MLKRSGEFGDGRVVGCQCCHSFGRIDGKPNDVPLFCQYRSPCFCCFVGDDGLV